MPAPMDDLFTPPTLPAVRVALEPVPNALQTLNLISKAEQFSGLGDWLMQTVAAMTPEQYHRNYLVIMGFYFAIVPDRSWPSFPAYLNHLERQAPEQLVTRLMHTYAQQAQVQSTSGKKCDIFIQGDLPASVWQPALQSPEAYLDFLKSGFSASNIDEALEREAFEYVTNPPALKRLILAHLTDMWNQYLAEAWERERPVLKDAVRAFQHHDLVSMDRLEAARLVTGQYLRDSYLGEMLEKASQVIFVPSLQIGPYLGKMISKTTMWVIYGARLPEGASIHAPDLSRAEILVRLGALSDDTRLRILQLIGETGELRSQDIMQRLDLSQSAASRHLAQLSATGYLTERRCEGAKCFALNPEKIGETLKGIEAFLLAGTPVAR